MSTLSIKIGAVLDGSFNAAIKGSSSQLSSLGENIKRLDSSLKSVSKFKQLGSDVFAANAFLYKASASVAFCFSTACLNNISGLLSLITGCLTNTRVSVGVIKLSSFWALANQGCKEKAVKRKYTIFIGLN